MTRWLPQWFGWNPRPQPSHRRSAGLRVEQLEARHVPAPIVVNTLDNPGDLFDLFTSLQEAIDIANNLPGDDIITFATGLTGIIQLSGPLPDLSTNIDIQGPGANVLTVRRNTGGDYRIFTVAQNTAVTLSGLTLANGNAIDGGGINNSGTLTVTNCTLSGNTAGAGGGINNIGTLTVSNSTLFGNTAIDGGGILNGGTLMVSNSTLSGNIATDSGGGLLSGGAATLTNVTITANRSDHNNNLIGEGGGFSAGFGLTLHNTIVADNFMGTGTTRNDVFALVNAASSFNLIGDGTGLTGITHGVNGNLVGLDPLLGPRQNNGGPTATHALLPGSPAINRGLFAGAPSADQRGVGRRGVPDIGAFEFIPSPVRAIVAALVNKKVRKTRRLFVRVTFADTGALKVEVRSPFQRPGFRAIAVTLLDSNGDGVPDAVQLTARKGTRTFTRLFAV